MTPPASLIVINFGAPKLVRALLASLRDHPDRELMREVVIVDNGYPAAGDSRDTIRPADYPYVVKFVQNPDRSYASGINRGVEASSGDPMIVSNNDVEWLKVPMLRPIIELLERDSHVGVAGPQQVFPDGGWQASHGTFPSIRQALLSLLLTQVARNAWEARRFHRGSASPIRTVEYVDGAFMVIRRACIEALDGFDERYAFFGEDTDFCWRARQAGWRAAIVPQARLMHVRGATSTEIEPDKYAELRLTARCRFMAIHFGSKAASRYARLWRLRAWELAVIYGIIAQIRRTPRWRRRAELAAAASRAASKFHWDSSATATC